MPRLSAMRFPSDSAVLGDSEVLQQSDFDIMLSSVLKRTMSEPVRRSSCSAPGSMPHTPAASPPPAQLSRKPVFKITLPPFPTKPSPDADPSSLLHHSFPQICIPLLTPPEEKTPLPSPLIMVEHKIGPADSGGETGKEAQGSAGASNQTLLDSTPSYMDIPASSTASANTPLPSPATSRAIALAIQEITVAQSSKNMVNMVCQTLPLPIDDQEITTAPTAYHSLVKGLQAAATPEEFAGIRIVHALPSRFPVAKFPTSPPGTPSGAIGAYVANDQAGYFDQNIFSSAVRMVDRHDVFANEGKRSSIPSSPGFVAPAASIDVSLYERFIPPSTLQEFKDLFTVDAPSALVDRLRELSSTDGSLLLIYPTSAGSQSFKRHYLGPVIEPVLRNIIVSQQLSADLGYDVSEMEAANSLLPFEKLQFRLRDLLRQLNTPSRNSHTGHTRKSNGVYSIKYAAAETVHVSSEVWKHWWTQQETPRITAATAKYFRRAKHLPSGNISNNTALTREILEGVHKRRDDEDGFDVQRKEGIEVGVFVVIRGH